MSELNEISGHSGELAVHVARAHGVETMFTLSGAHVFPMYDGAVQTQKEGHGPQVRLLDVRHEQTAAFAAEATRRLTRVPGSRSSPPGRVSPTASGPSAGPVRRVVDGRDRCRAAEPLGHRLAPGARPAADHRPRRQGGPDADDRRRRRGRRRRGLHPRPLQPPWPGLRRRPDGRVLQLLHRHRRIGRGRPRRAGPETRSRRSPGCWRRPSGRS